jgi:hypothetical protein
MDIIEIVDKLIGDYSVHGETNAYKRSLEHLDEVDKLVNHLVGRLQDNVDAGEGHTEYSMREVADKSSEILDDISDYISNAAVKPETAVRINEAFFGLTPGAYINGKPVFHYCELESKGISVARFFMDPRIVEYTSVLLAEFSDAFVLVKNRFTVYGESDFITTNKEDGQKCNISDLSYIKVNHDDIGYNYCYMDLSKRYVIIDCCKYEKRLLTSN